MCHDKTILYIRPGKGTLSDDVLDEVLKYCNQVKVNNSPNFSINSYLV